MLIITIQGKTQIAVQFEVLDLIRFDWEILGPIFKENDQYCQILKYRYAY